MFAWIRADEISFKAAAMLGSAGWFEADSWGRAVQTNIKTIIGVTPSIGRVTENLAGVLELGMAVDRAPTRAQDKRFSFCKLR